MAELSGTENRIAVARNDFNAAVQEYNTRVRRFPTNILAGIMGFHPRRRFHCRSRVLKMLQKLISQISSLRQLIQQENKK